MNAPVRNGSVFAAFAALLLAGTLAWHLPLMLWDHIDLVPMFEAWQAGALAESGFWRIHDDSHLHVAAYAVLLATTALSGGQPWLDCLASLFLLLIQCWILVRIARDGLGDGFTGIWAVALLFVAFHPGHLVNLQWGWQVAVFISTLGAVAAIGLLTRPRLGMPANLLAVTCATVGVLGFSNTLAVFPIAIVLVALHPAIDARRKVALALPWIVACTGLSWWLASGRQGGAPAMPDADAFVLYVLNYLGAGVSRLATALAPVWAVLALGTAAWTAVRHWHRKLLPWLALMLFAVGCAMLTALGRAAEFGPDHAFVTRYVSFSSLFWFGWMGLMLAGWRDSAQAWRRWVRPLLSVLLVFVFANGIHMAKQAQQIHQRANDYAAHIRAHYPNVDGEVMAAAYGWRAELAHERLGALQARGFAPFSGSDERER